MNNKSAIAVLGAGSWGTAVAIHLARQGYPVALWGRDPTQILKLQASRENSIYLPGVSFPASLTPTNDLGACVAAAHHLFIAVPSHAFASLLNELPDSTQALSWLTKGIDPNTHSLLSQLISARFGNTFPMVVVSGPSFAREVALDLPTALVIAGNNPQYSETIRHLFDQRSIRTYLSDDLIGVQLCGAMKNVIAIACGVSDGLVYGANAKAALITRGLDEMQRLGKSWHADASTFSGLAGVGDLVLTCTDNQSRNRRFGMLLGQGMNIEAAEQHIGQVVEGKTNAAQVCWLAAQHNIELPICNQVNALMQGRISAKQAAEHLMKRPLR